MDEGLGNVVQYGTVAGGVTDSALTFDTAWLSTDHPAAGIRQRAGTTW